jgi:hypothetical protein
MSEEITGNSEGAPAQESVISTEGSFINSLPEDLRGNPSLQDFKDVGGLAKSYAHSQQMLGSSIRIPGEDASTEAHSEFYTKLQGMPGVVRMPMETGDEAGWNDFYSKAGRPETAEGYSLNLPEGMQTDPQMMQIAHSMGLNNAQVNKFVAFQNSQAEQSATMSLESRDTAMNTLKSEWGADYNSRMDGAKAAIATYAGKNQEAVNELINGEAGNNPVFLQMLSDLHGNMQEQGIAGSQGNDIVYGNTPEMALQQITEMRGNKQHPAFNPEDPGHKAGLAKMRQLYVDAYGK